MRECRGVDLHAHRDSHQVVKLSPHAHVCLTFGLLNTKPDVSFSSTKSISDPSTDSSALLQKARKHAQSRTGEFAKWAWSFARVHVLHRYHIHIYICVYKYPYIYT